MTTESTPKSLQEFANTDRRDVKWLEEQPIWPEVVEGYRSGLKVTTIHRWLIKEHGYTQQQLPSPETMSRHLRYNYTKDNA